MFGFDFQASQFQSLNPAFILLLGPVFSWLWVALARRRFEPSTPAKFGLGVVQVGLGFAALVYGAQHADANGMVAAGWLALAYLLHTTGELCLSPVGLSMVTKLSVPRVVGLMMGVWFLSSAFSHYVGGLIAAGASVERSPGGVVGARIARGVRSDVRLRRVGRGRRWHRRAALSPLMRRFMHEPCAAEGAAMTRPLWVQYKTARCILWSGERFLLAVHHSYLPLKSRPLGTAGRTHRDRRKSGGGGAA